MDANNTTVVRVQMKGGKMKLINLLHPGGGLEGLVHFIAKQRAAFLYLALLYIFISKGKP